VYDQTEIIKLPFLYYFSLVTLPVLPVSYHHTTNTAMANYQTVARDEHHELSPSPVPAHSDTMNNHPYDPYDEHRDASSLGLAQSEPQNSQTVFNPYNDESIMVSPRP
jgi:hypothetical protein